MTTIKFMLNNNVPMHGEYSYWYSSGLYCRTQIS